VKSHHLQREPLVIRSRVDGTIYFVDGDVLNLREKKSAASAKGWRTRRGLS